MKKQRTQCNTWQQSSYSPTVYIAVRKNRLGTDRVDGEDVVYLHNGTEFQLEFSNDSLFTQKAEIWINGKLEKDALVLRTGEHFYLDRFMDKDRKLKFDVYEVDDNEEVRDIIEDNGLIEVRFFKEYIAPPQPIIWTYHNYPYINPYPYWGNTGTGSYINNVNIGATYSDSSTSRSRKLSKGIQSRGEEVTSGRTSDAEPQMFCGTMQLSDTIETGRVAQGNKSDQDFTPVNKSFEYFSNTTVKYHILPMSKKPHEVTTRNVGRDYCPSCGRRIKRGWIHCAGCGEKI